MLQPLLSYEVTVAYQAGAPQVTTRRMSGRALPSLPLDGPRPTYALEVVRPRTAQSPEIVLHRRPCATPGFAEAYGADSEWTPLPPAHLQMLVSLVPDFGGEQEIVAYAHGIEQFRVELR